MKPEPEPQLFKSRNRNRNRNHNFSKVLTGNGTGIVKNRYGSTTLLLLQLPRSNLSLGLEENSTCKGLVFCGVLDEGFLVNTQHVISTKAKFHHTSLGKKVKQLAGGV